MRDHTSGPLPARLAAIIPIKADTGAYAPFVIQGPRSHCQTVVWPISFMRPKGPNPDLSPLRNAPSSQKVHSFLLSDRGLASGVPRISSWDHAAPTPAQGGSKGLWRRCRPGGSNLQTRGVVLGFEPFHAPAVDRHLERGTVGNRPVPSQGAASRTLRNLSLIHI